MKTLRITLASHPGRTCCYPHVHIAGLFSGGAEFGGSDCTSDGTVVGGRVDNSIALRGPSGSTSLSGYCVLGVATSATVEGVSTLIDWGPNPSSSSAASAQFTTQASQARAVRLTLDHADVSPRMVRVYYSPDSNFSRLTQVISVVAPAKLLAVAKVYLGFGGVSVSGLQL